MEEIDYLIIGGGPSGYEIAAKAASLKKKTVLIERGELGGTCLNKGCIPTKVMAHAASLVLSASESAEFGIGTQVMTIDFRQLSEKRDAVISQLKEGIATLLSDVDIISGEAKFTGPRKIEVNGHELTARKIIIATGSQPAVLPVAGADTALTSDALLCLKEVPASMIIIGGGVIGLEFASIFNALGSRVTVIEYCKEILPTFDKDIAKRLRTQLSERGIVFITDASVTSVNGKTVTFESKGKTDTIEAEIAVMATGRRPVMPNGLDLAGIESSKKGITVNPYTLETTASGVYAIGDVNGLCMLAHAASAQGRRVLGEDVNLDVMPSVVFTQPECAMTGLTEAQCKESGKPFKSVKSLYRANGKALSAGESNGMVKLVFDPDNGKILGASIIGSHAADLIQEITLAITNGLSTKDLAKTIHPHPTLSEIIHNASEATLRHITGAI